MSTKYFGSLIMATPVFNTGGGDFTLVDDATQKNYPLGGIYVFPDASGRPRAITYAQWNPTVAATYVQGGPVYYKDGARSVITNEVTEAATYLVNTCSALFSFAGIILNPTVPTTGDFVFIQLQGFCDKIKMPAATTAGDILVLTNAVGTAPTDNVWTRLGGATDLTLLKALFAVIYVTTAVVGGGAGLGSGWIEGPLGLI
jgi:hypothetical protein